MARCADCGATVAEGCQCSMTDSDCFAVSGAGSASNPFYVEANLDPDPDNLLECNPSGLGAFLPPEIDNPPCCRVTHSTNQAITSGPTTILVFNLERYDTDSMHDITTNNSRITFNTAGVYAVGGQVRWEGNDAGDRRLFIRVNAGDTIASTEDSADQSDEFDQNVNTQWKFAVGDYIELIAVQNSGSTLNVNKDASLSPEFFAARVGVG